MDLSIIIPIYNTPEDSLAHCLQSIVCIEKIRYECLLIDDGSEPYIEKFCKEYLKNNANFRYYRKNNGGVSSARNLGIDLATGKYICFVDSDDTIEAKVFNDESIWLSDSDVILTDLVEINNQKSTRWYAFHQAGEKQYEDVIERMISDGKINGPYCKFIRKEFLDKFSLKFDETMVNGEDAAFIMQLLLNKPRVKYDQAVSYYYHHSYQNGRARFVKYPEKCIDDELKMYTIAEQCILVCNFEESQQLELLSKRKSMLVHNLFGRILDGLDFNIINAYLQQKIRRIVNLLIRDKSTSLDVRAKTELYLLNKGDKNFWRVISILRKIYFNIRGFV